MKLAIENVGDAPEIVIDDRGDNVRILIKGPSDSLELVLSQNAYDRLLSAAHEASKKRQSHGAGVRVGISDVIIEP